MLRPEDACQNRLSWFFYRIPNVQKVQTHVNLLDLAKSFPTVIYYFSLFHYYYTVTVQIQNLVSLQPRISLEEISQKIDGIIIWEFGRVKILTQIPIF